MEGGGPPLVCVGGSGGAHMYRHTGRLGTVTGDTGDTGVRDDAVCGLSTLEIDPEELWDLFWSD